MNKITIKINENELGQVGNWAKERDLFQGISVDQQTAVVSITYLSVSNRKRGQWGLTHEHAEELSADGQVLRITGFTGLKHERRNTGGRQKFCFIVFRGDSGHIYTHRAVASKGWMECLPEKMLSRLRKMGIGAEMGVFQQGDFLLKPANGNAYPENEFAHETMGSGHHNFEMPVLYASGKHGRQYKIIENTQLIHTAVDGIQHPTITIPPGIYSVGTTSPSLVHGNMRD